jgi:hypothetical protein
MRLGEKVMELLRRGDGAGLERLVRERAATVRHLQGRLWDPDESIRRQAAAALAAAAAAHPGLGRDLLRRLLWALNDESATNGRYAVPALAAVGVRCPELIRPFVSSMVRLLEDDGLRPALLGALEQIGWAAPDVVAPYRGLIRLYAGGEWEVQDGA